jgi:predicted nuclease with TOPRIM domain
LQKELNEREHLEQEIESLRDRIPLLTQERLALESKVKQLIAERQDFELCR